MEGEATVTERDLSLTRFADSRIHQNLAEQDATLRVRIRRDGRTGVATTNRLDPEGIDEAVARAAAVAAHAAPDPDPAPLPQGTRHRLRARLGAGHGRCGPGVRAEGARTVIAAGVARGLTVSGAYSIEAQRMTVANTTGLTASHRGPRPSW